MSLKGHTQRSGGVASHPRVSARPPSGGPAVRGTLHLSLWNHANFSARPLSRLSRRRRARRCRLRRRQGLVHRVGRCDRDARPGQPEHGHAVLEESAQHLVASVNHCVKWQALLHRVTRGGNRDARPGEPGPRCYELQHSQAERVTLTAEPFGITAGPDGLGNQVIWFTDLVHNALGKMDAAGNITEVPLSSTLIGFETAPTLLFNSLITAGPDGKLYFTEASTTTPELLSSLPVLGFTTLPRPLLARGRS